jgi:NAD(P)-dependent dehydrogenase (short-subunit alcohol dehydrogenase family)
VRLENTIAVITGAGRGIGEAVALAFAGEGADLVLASRTEHELRGVADQIESLGTGRRVQVVAADVSVEADAVRIARTALDTYGRIDVLVNAAGVYGPIGPLWDVDVEAWIRALQINLVGTLHCCRAVLPHMIERRRGKIVNYSGGGATSPLPRFSAYGVSKAAVVRLTETLAEEVKDLGIQVNAIAPGAVDTKLQDEVMAAGERAGEIFGRMQRLRETGAGGVPRELPAELTVYLASEASAPLSGKLVSAPYDGWQSWTPERVEEIMAAPWFTLRRLDEATLRPLLAKLGGDTGSSA